MLDGPAEQRAAGAVSAATAELAASFGNRLVTSRAVREQHANITTWHTVAPPDAVVFPQNTEDVQRAVRICARHRVPVIPFGTGTSLEGHTNAPFGGVSIDLKDMNRILEVHPEDFDCVIEPGVTRKRLNDELRDQGLFFPVDPGADASLGGLDRRVRYDGGAVRRHEGQRAVAKGRAAEWRTHDHGTPRAQDIRRL